MKELTLSKMFIEPHEEKTTWTQQKYVSEIEII